jgi:hypothetical protein
MEGLITTKPQHHPLLSVRRQTGLVLDWRTSSANGCTRAGRGCGLFAKKAVEQNELQSSRRDPYEDGLFDRGGLTLRSLA